VSSELSISSEAELQALKSFMLRAERLDLLGSSHIMVGANLTQKKDPFIPHQKHEFL
jgi:hypothetical protein